MHDKALASPIRLLDFVCATAWKTLATVSLSVHLVRSTKTWLSLSHHARSTLHDQAVNTNFDHDAPAMQHLVHVRLAVRTALALQHLAHVLLAVRANNHIDTPSVNPTHCQNRDIDLPASTNTRNDRPAAFYDSTDISYPQRSSSCILRLDRHQLPATIV